MAYTLLRLHRNPVWGKMTIMAAGFLGGCDRHHSQDDTRGAQEVDVLGQSLLPICCPPRSLSIIQRQG
jgi:hypothetical protein